MAKITYHTCKKISKKISKKNIIIRIALYEIYETYKTCLIFFREE